MYEMELHAGGRPRVKVDSRVAREHGATLVADVLVVDHVNLDVVRSSEDRDEGRERKADAAAEIQEPQEPDPGLDECRDRVQGISGGSGSGRREARLLRLLSELPCLLTGTLDPERFGEHFRTAARLLERLIDPFPYIQGLARHVDASSPASASSATADGGDPAS
jgi:hypothetical protein